MYNDLRTKVTQDVATNAGKFDIATIGSYETPIWGHNGWLQDLSPYLAKMSAGEKSSYNYDDLLTFLACKMPSCFSCLIVIQTLYSRFVPLKIGLPC